MEHYFNTFEAISLLIESLNRVMAEQLRVLLETKHLYQKVTIDSESYIERVQGRIYGDDKESFETSARQLLATEKFIPSEGPLYLAEKNDQNSPTLTLLIHNVKVFCSECDARETFNPVYYVDVTNVLLKRHLHERRIEQPPPGFQLFLLAYQCQHCMGAPAGFLVRRQEWQLILEGRSPMEHVEVPPFIPKTERVYFRDAVIAMHGGKTLAALFYLRLFIEQFARRKTGMVGRATGEQIMAAYNDTVPTAHRDHMPSLRHWYDRLSEALHTAREDEDLFETAKAEIEQHFDIRRVFKIP